MDKQVKNSSWKYFFKRLLPSGKAAAFLFFFMIPLSAWAQQVHIRGSVVDQEGQPLIGVSVTVKGTSTGTSTDIDGNFSINAASNAVLQFTYLGMQSQEVPVAGKTSLIVTMKDDSQSLEEVVVVGYGTQKKKDLTGAVALVSTKDISSRPVTQIAGAIEGKSAGVQIMNPSGKPSSGISIRVRGNTSITAENEPLYVIDGVPAKDIKDLNPSDVESITVLKDASSAAIYGASGANGVVLVTTKRGKTGKAKVDFNAYSGFSDVIKKQDVLNNDQYYELMGELGYSTDWSKYRSADGKWYNSTDWQDEIFHKGSSQNYQLAVSGGNEKTTYYLSGGWIQQNGVVETATMNRYNFKISLDQKISKMLTIGANATYSRWYDVDVTDNANVSRGGVLLGSLTTPSMLGIYNADGTFTGSPWAGSWENPMASLYGQDRSYVNRRLLGNIYADVFILPELKFRSSVGMDYNNSIYDSFIDPFRTDYGRANKGLAQSKTDMTNYWIVENTLTYTKTLAEKHNLTALIGSAVSKTKNEMSDIKTKSFSSAAIPTTNGGADVNGMPYNNKKERANASFLGRVNYSFDNRYLLTANFRADGSSVFGSENRWGYFPSFSAGWRISEESFMKDKVSWIDELKIRAGWGTVGNDQIDYYGWYGKVSPGANYPIEGATQPGTYPSTIENRDLKWETTEQTNIGIDFTTFGSRLTVTADAYVKNTRDLLLNVPVPTATGFDLALSNVGEIQNKGFEFMISSRNLTGEFEWATDFNISFNRNKVIKLAGENTRGEDAPLLERNKIFDGEVYGRGYSTLAIEGKPLGQIFGYISQGVNPENGMMVYKKLEENEIIEASDKTIIGDANPDFIYGITNTFAYKNFGLNIFIQGVQGNDILNASRVYTEGLFDYENQSIRVMDRWKTKGQTTDIPKATANDIHNSEVSTRFLEDGSYLRVKSMTFSYNLPNTIWPKVVSSARFYISGENLLTITDYSGFDPEVNAFGTTSTAQGVDFGTYPQSRNFIFGMNLTF